MEDSSLVEGNDLHNEEVEEVESLRHDLVHVGVPLDHSRFMEEDAMRDLLPALNAIDDLEGNLPKNRTNRALVRSRLSNLLSIIQ